MGGRLPLFGENGKEIGKWRKGRWNVLSDIDFSSGVAGCEFYGRVTDEKRPLDTCGFYMCINCRGDGRYFVFTSLGTILPAKSIEVFIRALSAKGWVGYGFGCLGESFRDPYYYAIGITKGYSSDATHDVLASSNARWMAQIIATQEKKSYLNGKIKDVYELNILNTTHVDAMLQTGVAFGMEINTRGPGDIYRVEDGVYLWKLDLEELREARVQFLDFKV